MVRKLKKKRRKRKYRHKDAFAIKYEDKEHMLEQLRVLVERGETINSIGNMFTKNAGFAVYRPVEMHVFGDNLTDEEIKELMDEVDEVIVEVKKKQCYPKEPQPNSES